MKYKIYRIIHLVLTGMITIPITLFVASGGLGENFTGNVFVYPQFLLVIVVWTIGAVLSFNRKTAKYGLIISALPPVFFIGNIIFAFLKFGVLN
ncbi:hypothetical protein [Halobacillus ihumii]|uniref:hypothetical protein n=1 Tax=Halobacillus ihumii TaxID=2686092 RepID=UPI0013D323E8|nr:hypothetical protein [Halobacillus ihumii]